MNIEKLISQSVIHKIGREIWSTYWFGKDFDDGWSWGWSSFNELWCGLELLNGNWGDWSFLDGNWSWSYREIDISQRHIVNKILITVCFSIIDQKLRSFKVMYVLLLSYFNWSTFFCLCIYWFFNHFLIFFKFLQKMISKKHSIH